LPERTLILGYGNPDRQDDGVAWHILCNLASRLDRPIPSFEEGFTLSEEDPDLFFVLQLTPELAEMMANYERVCLIDAHTGSIPEDINLIQIAPEYQKSPLTHHTTPQTCLALAKTIYNSEPEAILVSVRGFEFDFSHHLSMKTKHLARQAEQTIWSWYSKDWTT
jgi:hydrogenase maturation protease